MQRSIFRWCLLNVCFLLLPSAICVAQETLQFVVRFAPQVRATPFTGRVLVMLGRPGGAEPRLGPNWFQPSPCYAVDVKSWRPETDLVVGGQAFGYPQPLKELKTGEYTIQAVLDQEDDTAAIGNAPGNGISTVVTATLDPAKSTRVNLLIDHNGKRRPVARRGAEAVLFIKPFVEMETVQGYGGQMGSFEAVFSPRGRDGKPLQLWSRETGAIDPKVAKEWEKYDIGLTLERHWQTLGPKLRGKLHVWTGELDTFYLNGAVERLRERLDRLGSDADIEIIPGKDHGTILAGRTWDKIAAEMAAAFKKHYPTL